MNHPPEHRLKPVPARHFLASALLALGIACGVLGAAAKAAEAAPPFGQDERGIQSVAGAAEVRRSRLGVSMRDMAADAAAAAGLAERNGVVITQVEPGSPAAAAGIRPGDVLVAVNRRAVPSATALRNHFGLMDIGSAVELVIWRDGEHRTIRTWLARPDRSRRPFAASDA